jgi:ABC-type transport system involved in cytochrome c biogenesis permease subunit
LNGVPLILYGAAGAGYLVHFLRRSRTAGRVATALLAAAALAHTFVIGMQTMEAGYPPLVGTTAAVSAFVWLLGLAYLYTEITTDERAMGVFIVPLLAVLQVIPALDPTAPGQRPPVLDSPLLALHVSSLLFAYASFALACVVGLTYVLLFRELKRKEPGFFYRRLPSLQSLDAMNMRAVTIGWIFLTVGVAIGGIWASQAEVQASTDPRAQAMSLLDPKIFVALLCWGVYSFHLYARGAMGWGGWRAAWLSAIGFGMVLLNFLPVGYFFTRSHNF